MEIVSASLDLYRIGKGPTYDYDEDCKFSIHTINNGWSEATTSYENLDNATEPLPISEYNYSRGESTRWIRFDVTSEIRKLIQNPLLVNGFCIKTKRVIPTTKNGGLMALFASSENENVSIRPKLTIRYASGDYVFIVDDEFDTVTQFSTNTIKWHTNSKGPFTLKLNKNGVFHSTIAENINDNSYQWSIPLSSPIGNDLTITVESNNSSSEFGNFFTIIENIPVKKFPYEMNFNVFNNEINLYKFYWRQESNLDNYNWTSHKGATPSRRDSESNKKWLRPGPKSGRNGGKYLYTEGNLHEELTSILYTPVFDLTNYKDEKLIFWYHLNTINGINHVGTLSIDINVEGQWTKGIFSKSGNHGDRWNKAVIDLSRYKGKFVQFAFRSKNNGFPESDIAIDDFEISTGSTSNLQQNLKNSFKNNFQYEIISQSIRYNNEGEETTIILYSPLGKAILSKEIQANSKGSINFSQYGIPKGFYLLSFKNANLINRPIKIILK